MFEVELKAHVKDRLSVIKKLNEFSTFSNVVIKDDWYYHLILRDDNGNHGSATMQNSKLSYVTARIRREKNLSPSEYDKDSLTPFETFTKEQPLSQKIDKDSQYYLTYKRKEIRGYLPGKDVEVNDEKETTLSNPIALEELLHDSGFIDATIKHKDVAAWFFDTPYGKAHIELCTVPPLGDFLEIEIMCKTNEDEITKAVQEELLGIISKSGLQESDIEKKYYTEMLREVKKNV